MELVLLSSRYITNISKSALPLSVIVFFSIYFLRNLFQVKITSAGLEKIINPLVSLQKPTAWKSWSIISYSSPFPRNHRIQRCSSGGSLAWFGWTLYAPSIRTVPPGLSIVKPSERMWKRTWHQWHVVSGLYIEARMLKRTRHQWHGVSGLYMAWKAARREKLQTK